MTTIDLDRRPDSLASWLVQEIEEHIKYCSVVTTRNGGPDVLQIMENELQPVIYARFSILEAAKANAPLESGEVVGNVVLAAPELLA